MFGIDPLETKKPRISSSSIYVNASIFRKKKEEDKIVSEREKEGTHVHGSRASISRCTVAFISRTFVRESIRIRRLRSHGGFWPANLFSST